MQNTVTLHADLVAYCERIGITPKTFGQLVLKNTAFADRLQLGTVTIGKVLLARRFMTEHPEVRPREFGAVARAWRERVAGDAVGAVPAAHAPHGSCVGKSTAGTLDEPVEGHNQEMQAGEGA